MMTGEWKAGGRLLSPEEPPDRREERQAHRERNDDANAGRMCDQDVAEAEAAVGRQREQEKEPVRPAERLHWNPLRDQPPGEGDGECRHDPSVEIMERDAEIR